ncbi:hypothetical protein PR048_017222 [Dryococelus australis]|uniref:CCHC-type domain-containing protein n=1 Tax=Dryococelus australis TaxID=614101 RepID=A0ABQ9H8X9_9NEOP|nr:hypothetical protein PR048_017222 [Dryococelus australis]
MVWVASNRQSDWSTGLVSRNSSYEWLDLIVVRLVDWYGEFVWLAGMVGWLPVLRVFRAHVNCCGGHVSEAAVMARRCYHHSGLGRVGSSGLSKSELVANLQAVGILVEEKSDAYTLRCKFAVVVSGMARKRLVPVWMNGVQAPKSYLALSCLKKLIPHCLGVTLEVLFEGVKGYNFLDGGGKGDGSSNKIKVLEDIDVVGLDVEACVQISEVGGEFESRLKVDNLEYSSDQHWQEQEVDSGVDEKREVTCYNCRKPRNVASHCRAPKKEMMKCFNCGYIGHIAKYYSQGCKSNDDKEEQR